jgi:hypothetical protein
MVRAARIADHRTSKNNAFEERTMKFREVIVGLLVLVAVASYGFVAAITLAR